MAQAEVAEEVVGVGAEVAVVGWREEEEDGHTGVEVERLDGADDGGNLLLLHDQCRAVESGPVLRGVLDHGEAIQTARSDDRDIHRRVHVLD